MTPVYETMRRESLENELCQMSRVTEKLKHEISHSQSKAELVSSCHVDSVALFHEGIPLDYPSAAGLSSFCAVQIAISSTSVRTKAGKLNIGIILSNLQELETVPLSAVSSYSHRDGMICFKTKPSRGLAPL